MLSQRPSTVAAGGVRAAGRPAAAPAVGAAAAMPVQPLAALLQDDVRPLMVYCHMSHARKQQPQLDTATVKKLVAAQVSAAAPFLPHWYRCVLGCCLCVPSTAGLAPIMRAFQCQTVNASAAWHTIFFGGY